MKSNGLITDSKITKINTEEIRLRKSARKGTQLCLMLLGEKGTGKSTFLNNLCGRTVFPTLQQKESYQDPSHAHISPNLRIVKESVILDEGSGSPIALDIVLFPGAGDNLDDTKNPALVREYLEEQFNKILNEEVQIKRKTMETDPRPHVCFYFLKPTGRALKDYDIKMMLEIGDHVNIIPVLSKVDTLTAEELNHNKELIIKSMDINGINYFDFKDDLLSDTLLSIDETDKKNLNSYLKVGPKLHDMQPFGIACSNDLQETPDGEIQHVLTFEWGQVIVEDIQLSEFIYLKGIILGSHLQEFKDYTNNILYENYRTKTLLEKKVNKTGGPGEENENSIIKPSISSSLKNKLMVQNEGIIHNSNKIGNYETTVLNRELEEKNRIIEAYQRKISQLEGKHFLNPTRVGEEQEMLV